MFVVLSLWFHALCPLLLPLLSLSSMAALITDDAAAATAAHLDILDRLTAALLGGAATIDLHWLDQQVTLLHMARKQPIPASLTQAMRDTIGNRFKQYKAALPFKVAHTLLGAENSIGAMVQRFQGGARCVGHEGNHHRCRTVVDGTTVHDEESWDAAFKRVQFDHR